MILKYISKLKSSKAESAPRHQPPTKGPTWTYNSLPQPAPTPAVPLRCPSSHPPTLNNLLTSPVLQATSMPGHLSAMAETSHNARAAPATRAFCKKPKGPFAVFLNHHPVPLGTVSPSGQRTCQAFFCTRSSQVLRWFYPPGPWKSFHIRPQCWGHNFPNPLLPQKFPLPSLYHHSGHYTTSLGLPHPCHAAP